MKKTRTQSLRSAAVLTIATLLTTCLIGGTFAKYVTAASGSESVRVANWGFNSPATLELGNLFSSTYSHVKASGTDDVIAPGTTGSVSFNFPYDETVSSAPEVNYTFKIDVTGSADSDIKNNPMIQFALDDNPWSTWDNLISSIKALSGSETGEKSYEAGTLPAKFTKKDDAHVIHWQWIYEDPSSTTVATANTRDTSLGNSSDAAKLSLSISITATQQD